MGCIYIKREEISYDIDHPEFGSVTHKTRGFKCEKLDKLLYPKLAEKKGLIEKYPEDSYYTLT